MRAERSLQKSQKSESTFDPISMDQNTSFLQSLSWICSVLSELISSWLSMNVLLADQRMNMRDKQWSGHIDGQYDRRSNGRKMRKSV